ncbi:hypothetical protein [Streptomyces profundus]|uniref:hypothetical protein n=1 Tax=Streptomyces profundus TaxID=2867410 RepID=UPI001D166C4A|nr:hypothetical protein [Streptomyces sp. MA3_2.13]UED86785.1 hypothetical protein K4G22_23420 [Streptomyces sp. MA3_2.13]
MPKELTVDIIHNPSFDFSLLPPRERDPEGRLRVREPLDLVVMLRQHSPDRLHIAALAHGRRTPKNGTPNAYLTVTAGEILQAAARLRSIWRDQLVRHQPLDEDDMPVGGYPFSEAVDLGAHAEPARRLTENLVDEGHYFLVEKLLAGTDREISGFRAFLLETLAGEERMRVSFDSDLHLPWPMLAVRLPDGEDPRHGFLGYRHQIEQTGSSAYAPAQVDANTHAFPVTSLNTDSTLDAVGRAPEIRKLLAERSRLTVRTRSERLLEALAAPVLDEDVMYFWCHGAFVENGSPHPHLAVRLSDSLPIDADLVERKRGPHHGSTDALFRPFVLLNACHTGQTAPEPGLKHLGGALVKLGADGVLGPQIEIPQLFASEYALAFLGHYLSGAGTAGEIAMALVRRFVDDHHNPLALTYSVYCGIDSRLETAP